MTFVSVNGAAIHFAVAGDLTDKPVIVFSNSLGTDFRIWNDVVAELADDFAFVLYDKRGHGLSDLGSLPYVMNDHVGDLEALLDHIGIDSAIICGLSVGGLIAQGLCQRRPDLVRALILCDTAHKIGNDEMWNGRIEAVTTKGIASIADSILERWFSPAFWRSRADDLAGYRNMLTRTPAEGYAGTAVAIRDTDYTDAARQIAVPTLCVVGDQDGATPPDLVAELAGLIPGARYEVIEGAGHLPCIEQPNQLATLFRGFLATPD